MKWRDRIVYVLGVIVVLAALACMATGCKESRPQKRIVERRQVLGVVVGQTYIPHSYQYIPAIGEHGIAQHIHNPEHHYVTIRTPEQKFTRDSRQLYQLLDPGDSVVVNLARSVSIDKETGKYIKHWYDMCWMIERIERKEK